MTSLSVVFPKPTLAPFSKTEPANAAMVQLLRKELYTNAAAITSRQGGGAHGHLGLVMPAADYNALAGAGVTSAWVDPGPFIIAVGTAAVVATAAAAHQQGTENFNTFVTLCEAVKSQILEAVPCAHMNAHAHAKYSRITSVTPSQMLAHLQATCGTVTTDDS